VEGRKKGNPYIFKGRKANGGGALAIPGGKEAWAVVGEDSFQE